MNLGPTLAQQEHRTPPLHLDFALNYLIIHITICLITTTLSLNLKNPLIERTELLSCNGNTMGKLR